MTRPTDLAARIVVVGGGVAALETIAALRALARAPIDVTVVAPERTFHYRPLEVEEPFGLGTAHRWALPELVDTLGARFIDDAVRAVEPDRHEIQLKSGAGLEYDALVLATGAAAHPAYEHGVTFDRAWNAAAFEELLADRRDGFAERVAVIVPPGVSWTLPACELALLSAEWMPRTGESRVLLVTPESAPLAVFGEEAVERVASVLTDAGIEVWTDTAADVLSDTTLRIGPTGQWLVVDRIVSLPLLVGRRIPGVPHDDHGFLVTDEHGRVTGVDDVYAAGDGTAFWMKQGGLAAQQADAVAEVLAARFAGGGPPSPPSAMLRGRLRTASGPIYLQADLAGGQAPEVSDEPLWWPPAKVASRWLSWCLAERGALEGNLPSAPEAP